jgi:hypothetical protein
VAEAFRRTIESDIGVNRLGIDASRKGGAFPIVIISGANREDKQPLTAHFYAAGCAGEPTKRSG